MLDAAVYDYWWRDFQAQLVENSSTGIPLQILSNAGNARSYGLEIDSAWRPLRGLELQINANLLHTLITSGPFAGEGLSNAPKATLGAVVRYELPLGAWPLKLQLQVDGRAQSGVRFRLTQAVPALGYQSGFGILNARIGVASLEDIWTVSIWGRNLADKRYLVDVFDQSPINVLQIWNVPRTFGVSVEYQLQ